MQGEEAPWLQTLIEAGAGRMLQMNPKVRSDVFSTVFSKLQLFSDPLIAHATSHSDFKLDDFVTSDAPISLYLVVPFAHVDVIAPVFKLLINFMLRRFSDGETGFCSCWMSSLFWETFRFLLRQWVFLQVMELTSFLSVRD